MIKFILDNPYIIDLLVSVISFIVSAILVISITRKNKTAAQSDIDIIFEIINNMQTSEKALSPLKAIIGNVGDMKKDDVLTKLQNFCLTRGIKFDSEKISYIVEKLIEFSKTVNAKNKGDIING